MAYTTSAAVASEFKKITIDANSAVTSTEVDEFISQTDAMIDGVIQARYTVPVSASEALKILKTISTAFVAKRVADIMKLKTGEVEKEQEPKFDTLYYHAKKMLEQIRKGELILSGAQSSTSHQGVKSFNVDNSIEHTMKKGIDQW